MSRTPSLIPAERIEQSILVVRGEKVMLDSGLAVLYGVESRTMLQAVKRNRGRFPRDFMFQLSNQEVKRLRSQTVISSAQLPDNTKHSSSEVLGIKVKKKLEVTHLMQQSVTVSADASENNNDLSHGVRSLIIHGGRRYRPYVFTEQGVAMLSSVLNSPRAVAVNIEIMRAFVRLRKLIASHADLARKLATLEKKYDAQFKVVFDAIRELMIPPLPAKRRRIGFGRE